MVTPISFLSSAHKPGPIQHTGHINPFKSARPVVSLFGASDTFQKPKHHVLLPEGTPVYLVHGTDSSSSRLYPLAHWFKNDVITKHTVFVSNMPEVTNSIGIENSYSLILRDIGDYRFQLLNLQLRKLEAVMAQNPAGIGDFFKLEPEHREGLTPIIQEHIIKPLSQVPQEWQTVFEKPLTQKVKEAIDELHKELTPEKLPLDEKEKGLEIYDTHFLESKADFLTKKRNYSADISDENDTINMRRITLEDASWLEGYLMVMEERLTPVLKQYFSNRAPKASDEENQKLAKTTAAKLLETLAPRIAMVGHSQGGLVSLYALLKSYKKMPKSAQVFKNKHPRQFEGLAGRGIGFQVHLNAPLHGIPEKPAALRNAIKDVQEALKDSTILSRAVPFIEKIIWNYYLHKGPAVKDMLENSNITKYIRKNLPLLRDHNVSIISVFDRKDTFIEPVAARLEAPSREDMPNVFNVELESRQQPSLEGPPDEILKLEFKPRIYKLLRLLPAAAQALVAQWVARLLPSHNALVTFPKEVSEQLGETLIADPQNQPKVLKTNNFEPFRYQSLVARSKSYQHHILEKPLPEAMAELNRFSERYPGFFHALIENARENLPFVNSASHQATEILNKTLDLVKQAIADKTIRKDYSRLLHQKLKVLADADIPSTSHPTVSVRAKALLATLDKKQKTPRWWQGLLNWKFRF